MDSMPLSKASRLFWLGRYYERTVTTLTYLWSWYDKVIDGEPPDYKTFCKALEIDCCYLSAEEFLQDYVFDSTNPDSLRTAADNMLGNGMMLRETIGSRTLSYLELAVTAMDSGIGSLSPTLPLQRTIDYILAFRGCYDDCIPDMEVRNIIKCGASVERLSLYLRLGWRLEFLPTEVGRLLYRTKRARLTPAPECLKIIKDTPLPLKEDNRLPLLRAVEAYFSL